MDATGSLFIYMNKFPNSRNSKKIRTSKSCFIVLLPRQGFYIIISEKKFTNKKVVSDRAPMGVTKEDQWGGLQQVGKKININ
jgi:hypothetical protein